MWIATLNQSELPKIKLRRLIDTVYIRTIFKGNNRNICCSKFEEEYIIFRGLKKKRKTYPKGAPSNLLDIVLQFQGKNKLKTPTIPQVISILYSTQF